MSARAESRSVKWDQALQDGRENMDQNATDFTIGYSAGDDLEAGLAVPQRSNGDLNMDHSQWNSWRRRRDRLRSEIHRGKEYLEQVQKELAESRARLEDWPAYERQCGRNPLLHLMQAVDVHERIAQFLPDWIRRREEKLAAAEEMDLFARGERLEPPSPASAKLIGSLASV